MTKRYKRWPDNIIRYYRLIFAEQENLRPDLKTAINFARRYQNLAMHRELINKMDEHAALMEQAIREILAHEPEGKGRKPLWFVAARDKLKVCMDELKLRLAAMRQYTDDEQLSVVLLLNEKAIDMTREIRDGIRAEFDRMAYPLQVSFEETKLYRQQIERDRQALIGELSAEYRNELKRQATRTGNRWRSPKNFFRNN